MLNEIQKSRLSQVKELIASGIEAWIKAGEIIAELLESKPESISEISEYTGMTEGIIRKFQAIGDGKILPDLLIADAPGIRKLAACPYSEQKHYFSNPIPVLIEKNNGSFDTINIKVVNLTSHQCKQVFASDHVRTEAEQRAVIESAAPSMKDASSMPYIIKNGRFIPRETGFQYTKAMLRKILKEM